MWNQGPGKIVYIKALTQDSASMVVWEEATVAALIDGETLALIIKP